MEARRKVRPAINVIAAPPAEYLAAAEAALRAIRRPLSRATSTPHADRLAWVAAAIADLVEDLRLEAGLETRPQPSFRPGGAVEWRDPPRPGPLGKRDRLRLRNRAIARLAACYSRVTGKPAAFGGNITTPAVRFVEAGLREVARLIDGVIVPAEWRAVSMRLQADKMLRDGLRARSIRWDALPRVLGGQGRKPST
jgi:hypothetical protein